MAITVPQVSPQARGSGTTLAATFSSTPALSSDIVVLITMNGDAGVSTVADNQSGNTYTKVFQQLDSSGTCAAACYWCPTLAQASGTFTVTMTPTTGASGGTLVVTLLEVAGLVGTIDQTGGSNGGGNVTSVTATATGANSQAVDLAVYAMVAKFNASNQSFFTAGPTNSWTNSVVDNGNTQGITTCLGYKILSAVETTSAASQTLTAATPMAAMVATFQGSTPTVFLPYSTTQFFVQDQVIQF